VLYYLKAKKRSRKLNEFWSEVGAVVGQSGDVTEKLIKNLSSEYQRVRNMFTISGAATETAQLRGCHELFQLFDSYYQLYFPHGGSTMPKFVLTEKTLLQ